MSRRGAAPLGDAPQSRTHASPRWTPDQQRTADALRSIRGTRAASVPRMLRNTSRERRSALLIRGPLLTENVGPGSAVHRTGRCGACHRARISRDPVASPGSTLRRVRDTRAASVPRMLRSTPRERRDALLIRGPLSTENVGPGSAVHRTGPCFVSPGARCAASGTRDGFR